MTPCAPVRSLTIALVGALLAVSCGVSADHERGETEAMKRAADPMAPAKFKGPEVPVAGAPVSSVKNTAATGRAGGMAVDRGTPPYKKPQPAVVAQKGVPEKKKVTLVAVGDLMFHKWIQFRARTDGYLAMFQDVAPLFRSAHIAFGNLETPAHPTLGIRGFSEFNTPPDSLAPFRKIGFTHFGLANNHIADQGVEGMTGAIRAVQKLGIATVGAGLKGEPRLRITTIHGLRVGIVGLTYRLNRARTKYKDQAWVGVAEFHRHSYIMHMKKQIARWKEQVDFLILSLHWGVEFIKKPSDAQRFIAKTWTNAGADVILGHHPHVLLESTYVKTTDGRRAFVIYSLGNFLSNMGIKYPIDFRTTWARRSQSLVLRLTLDGTAPKAARVTSEVLPVWCLKIYRRNRFYYKMVLMERELKRLRALTRPHSKDVANYIRLYAYHLAEVRRLNSESALIPEASVPRPEGAKEHLPTYWR